MSAYDTVFFDLDGTITDSKPGIVRCIKIALDAKGIPYTEAQLDMMVGPPFRVSMREILGVDGPVIEELIKLYRAEYEVHGWKECSVYDGVEELFARLKAAGKKLALATSKPLRFAFKMMEELNLAKYFDFIGGAASDTSRESKVEVIEYVIENMTLKERESILMVGDRLYDADGAALAHVDCAGVLWGYGSREELLSHGVKYLFATPREAGDLILG